MAKLVKIHTAKLNKLELEKNSGKPAPKAERNPNNQNQFRRQLVPDLYQESIGTMISSEKGGRMRIKECPHLFKIM